MNFLSRRFAKLNGRSTTATASLGTVTMGSSAVATAPAKMPGTGVATAPTAAPTSAPANIGDTTAPGRAMHTAEENRDMLQAGSDPAPMMAAENLRTYYGTNEVLKGISLSLPKRSLTALIGPSGCGKTTFLRTLNRMNDHIPGFRVEGQVLVDGQNIYAPDVDPVLLRRRVGMVFQRPNPFPLSILTNVTWGLRGHGLSRKEQRERAEESLMKAGLWDEVKDRLKDPALRLSGGQQQRLCIARALAVRPDVLLMDEPTSALDPRASAIIEELMTELKEEYTVVLVSHNMHQAARVSDQCAFFLHGEVVEYGPTKQIFENPQDERTSDYVSGRFS